MKTKGNKQTKVNIVTLGCSKNLVDSEVLLTQLRGNGVNAVHESKDDDANVVVINTCGFIDNAKQESIDTILRYVDAKEEGVVDKVYVTGCLSQRYKDDLEKEIPEVDAWFGTRDLSRMLKVFKANYKQELVGERILTNPSHFAYLKISEGCDRPCSFCAIPIMRGGHISRPMEELVLEASNLAKNGTKELLLIAQDSTYYGLDIYKKRNLAELLQRLSDVEGIDWIRLHYAFPTGFPMDALDVMAERSNICKYIDIPLQHGSTRMLQLMRRGTTREKTNALAEAELAVRGDECAEHAANVADEVAGREDEGRPAPAFDRAWHLSLNAVVEKRAEWLTSRPAEPRPVEAPACCPADEPMPCSGCVEAPSRDDEDQDPRYGPQDDGGGGWDAYDDGRWAITPDAELSMIEVDRAGGGPVSPLGDRPRRPAGRAR